MSKKIIFKGQVSSMTEGDLHKAVKFLNKCRYCTLGTIDSEKGVHLSILTTQENEDLRELWFATRTSTRKVVNIREDARCELLYTDNDNQISLTGKAEIVTEELLKKELSNIWTRMYIPEGPESDEMSLIKFIPARINAIVK